MEKATNLRQILKVYEPNPLQGDDFNKFHVDASDARGDNSSEKISMFFSELKDTPQKILFMGHRGSGKSTELWKVITDLEPNFKIISFSIKEEIDIIDLKYIDLIFLILKKLLDSVKDEKINLGDSLIDNLYNYWYGKKILEVIKTDKYEAGVNTEAKLNILNQIIFSIKGILSTGKETKEIVRTDIEPSLSELLKSMNDIITKIKIELVKKNKVPLIIIEDLDKLEIPIAEDLFLNHKNILTALDIHIIYTFPVFLRYSSKYSEIKDAFSLQELLSVIKINNKNGTPHDKGRRTLKNIIEMRADKNLFEDGVLDFVIEKTGGVLRNIFEILKDASLRNIVNNRNSNILTLDIVKNAYMSFKSDFERKIRKEHIDKLKEIYHDPQKRPLSDDVLMELLYNTAVIEYNGERWCNLHPAVEEILKERNLI